MSQQDKRCGTCKFWQELPDFHDFGECNAPAADSIIAKDTESMRADYGKKCPCWEPK